MYISTELGIFEQRKSQNSFNTLTSDYSVSSLSFTVVNIYSLNYFNTTTTYLNTTTTTKCEQQESLLCGWSLSKKGAYLSYTDLNLNVSVFVSHLLFVSAVIT